VNRLQTIPDIDINGAAMLPEIDADPP